METRILDETLKFKEFKTGHWEDASCDVSSKWPSGYRGEVLLKPQTHMADKSPYISSNNQNPMKPKLLF